MIAGENSEPLSALRDVEQMRKGNKKALRAPGGTFSAVFYRLFSASPMSSSRRMDCFWI